MFVYLFYDSISPTNIHSIVHSMTEGEGKVVLVLFLTEHHTMKVYGEWRYSSTYS